MKTKVNKVLYYLKETKNYIVKPNFWRVEQEKLHWHYLKLSKYKLNIIQKKIYNITKREKKISFSKIKIFEKKKKKKKKKKNLHIDN